MVQTMCQICVVILKLIGNLNETNASYYNTRILVIFAHLNHECDGYLKKKPRPAIFVEFIING